MFGSDDKIKSIKVRIETEGGKVLSKYFRWLCEFEGFGEEVREMIEGI